VMNEHEKSDGLIVPKKPPNKAGDDRLRRWWREGGWPRGGRSSMTRTGLSAGLCVPSVLGAHVSAKFRGADVRPEVEAGCGSSARPDLWRGRWATTVPTPTNDRTTGIPGDMIEPRKAIETRITQATRNIDDVHRTSCLPSASCAHSASVATCMRWCTADLGMDNG
jgi:hypothetical protein